MSPIKVLGWAAFAWLLLSAVRYLLAARVYLTSALREVEVRPIERQRLDPGELRLLTLLDDDLATAGFRSLGFGTVGPNLTYYGRPLATSVYVNEKIPAFALVYRHLAPEYGRFTQLEVTTALASGDELVTVNTPVSNAFLPPGNRIESLPGLSVGALVERHVVRVESVRASSAIAEHSELQTALALCAAGVARVRSLFRARQWVVPTANPHLDRFTLRGAFTLTHRALTSARRRVAVSGRPPAAAAVGSLTSDDLASLRVEADFQVILAAAEHPEPVPGTPWPLLAVIVGTAILSFVAMALVWDVYFAALILAVITFHEAGHAVAMRLFGYRDVHVFFVPLLGAMTVGRAVVTTVRDRLLVLLAGPVPGLFLAVVLLAIDQTYGPVRMLRQAGLALFVLNALNLLPFTPLDGGRVLEALTRPESIWRLIVHGVSAAGLLAVAAALRDPIVAVLGALWVAVLPRSWATYKLRSKIAARVHDRGDFRSVARTALEVMTGPAYSKWRAVTRQVTARAIGRLFAESVATPADRRWGAVVYAAAWLLVVAAVMLWKR